MSDIFAEATVRISPSLTGFKKDLEKDLKEIMANVKVQPIRIRPALTRNFVGDLRKQVNDAILQAQRGVRPVVIKTIVETPSRRALAALVQAPVSLPGRVGHIAPPGAGAGVAADQERINSALSRGAVLLGGVAEAEEKVERARKKGGAVVKDRLTQEERTAKANRAAAAVTQTLNEREFKAATVTGELAQEKKKLAIADKAVADATAARTLQLTKETKATQEAAIAARALHFERVRQLEVAGAGTGAAAGTGLSSAAKRARTTGFGNLSTAASSLKAADAAFAKTGTSVKDLAAQEAILAQRSEALKISKLAVSQALKSESAALRIATAATLQKAEADRLASQTAVKGISDQIALEKRLAQASAASARSSARAAAAQASSEKRRSEQLSRGGQASILSLAGIRGATLAASRSFLVGAAAITVFARAVKQFADLERNLHVFAATTSATANQMEAVRAEATALGADLTLPSVAAGDAAGAMVELAKAGLTVQDSISGARGVLQLATAAAIDTADAVRLVANVLNAFSLSGREAITVADTLANAANAAQGSIADIGTAFQQAASAGHQVGLDFQDTATFLTILAKNGLRGSDAGTSLRTALIRLVNPSEKAKKAFEELGIVLRDASGNLRPDVFLQIAQATEALTPAARDATIALIGGQDAFRAVTILGRQSVDSFLAMRKALRQTGTAAELAEARTEGLHGAMDGLQSVLETIGTNVAGHVGPALSRFVRTISTGLTAFSQNEQVARTLNQTLGATSQAFNLLGQAISGVAAVALPLANLLSQAATAIGVNTIIAGVVAYKALNAVLDGVILRVRILKPLFAIIATARIGAALSSGATAISLITQQINKLGPPTATMAMGVARLQGSFGTVAKTASSFSVAMAAVRPALIAAATSTTVWTIAIAAAAAGLFILVTRATAQERAFSRARKATEELANAYSRLKSSAQEAASAQRSVTQLADGLTQATLNRARAEKAFAESDAAAGSVERRQLLLDLKVTTQDVTFATQDYRKALKDLEAIEEDRAAQEDELNEKQKEKLDSLRHLITQTRIQARISVGAFGTEVAPNADQQVKIVQKIRDELAKLGQEDIKSGDAFQEAIGRREKALSGFFAAAEKNRKSIKPIVFTMLINAPDLKTFIERTLSTMKFASKEARDAFIKDFINFAPLGEATKQRLLAEFFPAVQSVVHTAAEWAARKGGPELGAALAEGATAGFVANFDVSDIVATAQAQGLSSAQTLARLRTEQARAQREFNKINKATKGGTVFTGDAQQTAFEDARDELNAANDEIDRITGEISQASEDASQKIKDAQQTRDSAQQQVIDGLLDGRRATALQRKITTAGLSEWLGDDLKTTEAWLNYLKNLAKTLPARLKAAGASAKLIAATAKAISDLIFETTNTLKKVAADIKQNTEDRRKVLFDLALERADLRISIAQSRENTAAELRARRQRLDVITKELVRVKHALGRNSIEWLRLKDAQIAEIASIRELNGAVDDRKNAAAQLQFSFLQMIQGFTGNLLGNLIPGGIGGLVGGTVGAPSGGAAPLTPGPFNQGGVDPLTGRPFRESGGVNTALNRAKTTSDAMRDHGFTKGQGQTTNFLLRQIHAEVKKFNRGSDHPEAKQQRKSGSAALDVGSSHGSTHGM